MGGAMDQAVERAAKVSEQEKCSTVDGHECSLDKDHDAGSDFFVNIARGKDWRPLLGPYTTHHEAIANVERGRRLAVDADPTTWFDSFGTCKAAPNSGGRGIFGK